MTVAQCEILLFFSINNFICKARERTQIPSTIFISIIVLKVLRIFYNTFFHLLCWILFRPLLMQVCCVLCLLRPSRCFHACKQLVESGVSAWCLCWRELRSIPGWGCYPGAWAQSCTVISLRPPLFYDRRLREEPSNYLHLKTPPALPLQTLKNQHIALGWDDWKYPPGSSRHPSTHNLINEKVALIMRVYIISDLSWNNKAVVRTS